MVCWEKTLQTQRNVTISAEICYTKEAGLIFAFCSYYLENANHQLKMQFPVRSRSAAPALASALRDLAH